MQVTTSSSGTGVYHSSGPLSFDLVAGKYYYIAVHIEGSHTASYTSQGVTIQPVSFGQALGQSRITSGIPVSIASFSTSGTSAYPHRLTTAKP